MQNDHRNRQLAAGMSKLALERSRLLVEEAELWRGLAALLVEASVEEPEPRPVTEQAKPMRAEPPADEPREYLTPSEAAHLLNMSAATLAKWRSIGGGPTFVKIGGRVLYRREDLTTFVSERSFAHTSAYSRLAGRAGIRGR